MTSVDLLSPQAHRKRVIRRAWRLWTRVLLGLVLLLSGATGFAWTESQRTFRHRMSLEAQYAPIERLTAEIASKQRHIDKLRQEQRVAIGLATVRSPLGPLGAVSAAAGSVPAAIWLEEFDFRAADTLTPGGRTHPTMRLQGTAKDEEAVSSFVDALKGENGFATVELKSSAAKTVEDRVVREFLVEVQF